MIIQRLALRFLSATLLVSSILVTGPAEAEPVLYRITSLQGQLPAGGGMLPGPFHPPIEMPAPGIASVMASGTGPAAVVFPSGDLDYSHAWLNPFPPNGIGIFYSSQRWYAQGAGGSVGANPTAMTVTGTPIPFPAHPPEFPSSAPNIGAGTRLRVVPGAAKFGGTWDLGLRFENDFVHFLPEGLHAGSVTGTYLVGHGPGVVRATGLGRLHPTATTNPSYPVFSATVCPADPCDLPLGRLDDAPSACPFGSALDDGHGDGDPRIPRDYGHTDRRRQSHRTGQLHGHAPARLADDLVEPRSRGRRIRGRLARHDRVPAGAACHGDARRGARRVARRPTPTHTCLTDHAPGIGVDLAAFRALTRPHRSPFEARLVPPAFDRPRLRPRQTVYPKQRFTADPGRLRVRDNWRGPHA